MIYGETGKGTWISLYVIFFTMIGCCPLFSDGTPTPSPPIGKRYQRRFLIGGNVQPTREAFMKGFIGSLRGMKNPQRSLCETCFSQHPFCLGAYRPCACIFIIKMSRKGSLPSVLYFRLHHSAYSLYLHKHLQAPEF